MTPGPGRRLSSQDQPGTAPQLRAVCLVGFMGAGKTSVGQVLAQQLGWPFIDLDQSIEQRHQCSIAEMFRKAGEAEFRRAEHAELRAVLQQLSPSRPAVVALGGGAFVQDDNVALLRDSQAACIFLDAPVEELWRRSCDDGNQRPLASAENQFRQLYELRGPRYMEADVCVPTAGRNIQEIVAEIVSRLGLRSGVKET